MTHRIATQTQIQIANHTIDGYKLSDGEWCLSLRGLAQILNKSDYGVRNFFSSTLPKLLPDIDLRVRNIDIATGSQLRMVTVEMVGEYLTHWAFKGDKKAQELVKAFTKQSLELRLESSLPTSPAPLKEAVDEVVQIERQDQIDQKIQRDFQIRCVRAIKHLKVMKANR